MSIYFFELQGYKAWNTFGTHCCIVSTWLEFYFSSARIWWYTAYHDRVVFQVNFTKWIMGQAWWFWKNHGFSKCQSSTFCLNFSWCNIFNSFVLCHTIPYYTILYHTIPYYTVIYRTITYYTILYHTIPYYTIIYHIIPYYTKLYHTIP